MKHARCLLMCLAAMLVGGLVGCDDAKGPEFDGGHVTGTGDGGGGGGGLDDGGGVPHDAPGTMLDAGSTFPGDAPTVATDAGDPQRLSP